MYCTDFADPEPAKESHQGPACGPVTAEPSQQAEEASKLSVWIQDGRIFKKKFKLRRTDPFSKLMKAVQQHLVKHGKVNEADKISFTWEEELGPEQTPEELDWEEEEVVDIKW